ncbi:MAG: DNA-directed RNA polymerase subunit alpha [Albidovulum sp.]|nr:DNA-directed RNA polymerase subunit alpha [Albidovulum sp.]MDE0304818.1 DNA-directed RNA polymerase subunit alpha [Albidovulum sp.]MDE0534601.1 DNA-directed RNA polymerase subunit alpha [Albidovulum sp.]
MNQDELDDFVISKALRVIPGRDPSREAEIVAEPLERGFGLTLGNALRRVLLSSLRGAAITSVHFEGVQHEFSSISGVREDVTDIVLNLKEVVIRKEVDGPRKLFIRASKSGEVKAGDISETAGIKILNKDLVICHLDEGTKLNMELTVTSGKGYVPAPSDRPEDAPIGLIFVDAKYSPVKKASYDIQPTREGQIMDFDKLTLKVETDGSVAPDDAVAMAARITQSQLESFVQIKEPQIVKGEEDKDELPYNKILLKKVEELELSVRAANCLKNDNIVYIGDLVQKSESEMMRTPNFGRKSLNEIKTVLATMDLYLGMEVLEWPPENIEDVAKQYEDEIA